MSGPAGATIKKMAADTGAQINMDSVAQPGENPWGTVHSQLLPLHPLDQEAERQWSLQQRILLWENVPRWEMQHCQIHQSNCLFIWMAEAVFSVYNGMCRLKHLTFRLMCRVGSKTRPEMIRNDLRAVHGLVWLGVEGSSHGCWLPASRWLVVDLA